MAAPMNILDLPNDLLIEILEFLSYEEISKKRLVCRRFDMMCKLVLNCGFNKAVRQHSIHFKRIKALLPRRESERRNHCLARHADILTSIETRISMLSMTYTKYIDLNLCCFIPGRVLDEIFRILHLIGKTNKPLRPHEVLQELRDISSMAIEHFDEKIKKSYAELNGRIVPIASDNSRMTSGSNSLSWTSLGSTNMNETSRYDNINISQCCNVSRQRFISFLAMGHNAMVEAAKKPTDVRSILEAQPNTNSDTSDNTNLNINNKKYKAKAIMDRLKRLERKCKMGVIKVRRMDKLQKQQSRNLQKAMTTIVTMNSQIVNLKKRMEEVDSKNRELAVNIKKIHNGEIVNETNTTSPKTSPIRLPILSPPLGTPPSSANDNGNNHVNCGDISDKIKTAQKRGSTQDTNVEPSSNSNCYATDDVQVCLAKKSKM